MFGLPAEIVIFSCWVGLFFVFAGLGLLVRRAWGLTLQDAETLLISFWLGWAVSIGVLQLWHFWWKVDGWALILVSLIGGIGLIWNAPQLWPIVKNLTRQHWFSLCLMLLMGLWLANRTTWWITRPEFDTGLYHIATMKWISSYAIVPGLGNLYGPLAMNNSYFLYAAMLDVGPWNDRSVYLTNGLLLYVLLAQCLSGLFKVSLVDDYRPYRLYYSLLLVPTIPALFGINWILGLSPSNLSPDVAVFVLGIVLSGQMLLFFLGLAQQREAHVATYNLFVVIVLAMFAVTVKLSLAFLAGTILCLILLVELWRNRSRWHREMMKMALIVGGSGSFFLLPWFIRNVVLTGYIVYPGTTALFPVEWQVPAAVIAYERILIVTLSHWFLNRSWYDTINDPHWLQPWLEALPQYVTMPIELTVLAVLCIAVCWGGTGTSRQPQARIPWLVVLPPIAAIISWFVLAPNPRFAGATFWIIAVVMLVFAVERLIQRFQLDHAAVLLYYGLFVTLFLYVAPLRNPLWIMPLAENKDGLAPTPSYPYETRVTDSGLSVHVPTYHDWCWNTPLPCTPFFRSDLRLRESGNLGKGFILERDGLRTNSPTGLITSSDLDVSLPQGWYEYEADTRVRWMTSPAYIAIYTPKAVMAKLSLSPVIMNIGNVFGETGQLTLVVNNQHRIVIPVIKGFHNEILFPLQRDFNVIRLELSAGNFIPAEVIPGNTDIRSLSIAFSDIEVTSFD